MTSKESFFISLATFFFIVCILITEIVYLWLKTDVILFYLPAKTMQSYLDNPPKSNLRLFGSLVPKITDKGGSPPIYGKVVKLDFEKKEIEVKNGLTGARLFFNDSFYLLEYHISTKPPKSTSTSISSQSDFETIMGNIMNQPKKISITGFHCIDDKIYFKAIGVLSI